jgi:hypothetical protein
MKQKPKREGPLEINMPFDEAIRRALQVKPPPEGWAGYGKSLKKARKAKRKKRAA